MSTSGADEEDIHVERVKLTAAEKAGAGPIAA